MSTRQRPTRAREKQLETVIAELIGALDQTTLRWVIFRRRHDDRTLAAMKAAREATRSDDA